jgi:hypothetical protein
MLLTDRQQVLAIHAQLARQGKDADFFFLLLQAELPRKRLSLHRLSPGNEGV